MTRLEGVFWVLRGMMTAVYPRVSVGLCLDDAAGRRSRRACAYCEELGDSRYMIGIAPKMLEASSARVRGVLAHELGHVIMLTEGKPKHSERDADLAAERLFGLQIAYDEEDIQTTGPGIRPRPAYLDDVQGRTCR